MRFALLLAKRPQDADGPAADDRWLPSEPCGELGEITAHIPCLVVGWIHGRRWHIFSARGAALPGDA